MAKAKEKAFKIRTVKSKEDRKRPSVFMRLKTDEAFKGFALFEPDPELKDNPGYFEYYDHYDQQGNSYVPCTGDRCPFCAANLNPSTRALTVWYFPDAEVKEQLKVFTTNYSTINQLGDESEDEGGLLGKMLRIKRLSDKGEYRVKVLNEKALTKAEQKKLLKQVEELNLLGMVERQLQVQMERLKAIEALEDDEDDDDDDEDEVKPKGRAITEEDEDEDEDEDDEDESDDEDSDDDEEEEDDDEDSEDDEESDEDDEDDEEDDEEVDEEPSEISGVFEIVKFTDGDETLDLKDSDGKKVKMWFGEDVEWEADELVKGASATLSALMDDEGDWVITEIKVKKARAKPKGGAGKGKGKGKK
jgi:hypothetical protein